MSMLARLLSATGYAAGMWLQGRVTDRTLKMEGEVFRVAVKLRLGMACGVVSPTVLSHVHFVV